MISGIFHEGSGLGDQLFRYITVRTLAEKKGFEFAMAELGEFKGADFLKLDYKNFPLPFNNERLFLEKTVIENGIDIRSYDPEINFVEDNTIIDGSFEDSKYWHHNLDNISKWLAVEPLNRSDKTCIVGFRGGEYATQPDLFLPKEYYAKAMKLMGNKNFEVHTDDPVLARDYLNLPTVENQPISHSKHTAMGFNWRSARYAKYAIIPNSAFFILPRILKHFEDPTAVTIAPRYWARYNTHCWARPACYYSEFIYI